MARGPILAAAAMTAALAAGLAVADFFERSREPAADVEVGVRTGVSDDRLQAFAVKHGDDVYWAGPLPRHRPELTATERGTFVRYLPANAKAGSKGPFYLTIATYRVPSAFAFAQRAGRGRGAVSRTVPDDGIAVWQAARPTNVYVAHAGSDRLVEVFDPQPARARHLVLSGRVRPLSAG